MDQALRVDVASLDTEQRRALERITGRELSSNQRVVISVTEIETQPQRKQTLDDWVHIYDGLSDDEIEALDEIVKQRANLTRDLP